MITPRLLPLPRSLERPAGVFWRRNEAFLGELAQDLQGKRVLEVFAGNGYLAGLLASRGVDVRATSVLSGMDAHDRGLYHPVEELDAIDAVAQLHQDRDVLLMCWPTTTPRAFIAAALWEQLKAAPVCFIGEHTDYSKRQLGGCATDEFHECFVPSKTFSTYRGNLLERACLGRLDLARLESAGIWGF